jgi:thymidylate synthase (FAD)
MQNKPEPIGESQPRIIVPQMEEMLGKTFRVLDKGHIRLIDYMGDDTAIVQAARVSYGKGTKTPSDDETLIRYLMRNKHTTPFEMCELKIHVRVPMDHWRQWIRHRTASVNEYSTRYSEAIEDKQKTLDYQWRAQSKSNKQGSGDFLDAEGMGFDLSQAEDRLHKMLQDEYERRVSMGVAKEQARKDLPLSTYTEAYWKIDLHNLLHFLTLRMDSHAQLEIRSYAEVIGHCIVAQWLPMTWKAFEDYRLNAHTFSGPQMKIIRSLLDSATIDERMLKDLIPNKRERDEFLASLAA